MSTDNYDDLEKDNVDDCECDDHFESDDDLEYDDDLNIGDSFKNGGKVFITLDDDTEVECKVLGIFKSDEKEYIALLPLDTMEEEVLLYAYSHDGDEILIENIEDDDEYESVAETFYDIYDLDDDFEFEEYDDDDDFDDDDFDDDDDDDFDDDDDDDFDDDDF